jgi:hypothetical protein
MPSDTAFRGILLRELSFACIQMIVCWINKKNQPNTVVEHHVAAQIDEATSSNNSIIINQRDLSLQANI